MKRVFQCDDRKMTRLHANRDATSLWERREPRRRRSQSIDSPGTGGLPFAAHAAPTKLNAGQSLDAFNSTSGIHNFNHLETFSSMPSVCGEAGTAAMKPVVPSRQPVFTAP